MRLVEMPHTPIVCRNLTNGQWIEPRGQTRALKSPYSGQVIGQLHESLKSDVDVTVQAAAAAFPAWRETPIKERSQILFRFRELMLKNIDRLSHTAAAEAGKTVAEAQAGIMKGLEVAEFALSLQNMDSGGAMEVSRGVSCRYVREPLGVVAGITPFNFPAMVPLWMYPIALTVGNCFILKPSEKVPLTSQLIGELILASGYPKGVFSIVNGGRETAEALIDNPDVQAVAFVGSTPAARDVYLRATSRGKRALTLGGAKNHLIVVPDADPEVTVRGVVDSFTGCAGQRCMAASLLVAVGEVDELLEKIVDAAARLQLGSGMGAIIDRHALERIEGVIDRAELDACEIRLDGRMGKNGLEPPEGYEGGNWLAPTVIDYAKAPMECAYTEIFGPVIAIVRVDTLSEAMQLEKNSNYGNATSVFTTSGAVANFVAQNATSGMVGINIGVPVPREPFSFGGTKESKFGHGDITGMSAVDFWSNLKKITTKWSVQADHNWMS